MALLPALVLRVLEVIRKTMFEAGSTLDGKPIDSNEIDHVVIKHPFPLVNIKVT